jgi:hypothetical protein
MADIPRTSPARIITMQDMLAHLERLRAQVAECELIRDLATDTAKRELFTRLADHHRTLAQEIERAIANAKPA